MLTLISKMTTPLKASTPCITPLRMVSPCPMPSNNDDVGRTIYIYNLDLNKVHTLDVYIDNKIYLSLPCLIIKQKVPFILAFPSFVNSDTLKIYLNGEILNIF